MSSAEQWAHAIMAEERLLKIGLAPVIDREPVRALVERVTGHIIVSGGLEEVFSQKRPTQASRTSDLFPIDVFYGSYQPQNVRITSFIETIEQHAAMYNATPEDVLTIVRIHEYAHATVHLGVVSDRLQSQMKTYGHDQTTDWATFGTERDCKYAAITEEAHELLAQAVTWACLGSLNDVERAEHLRSVFLALEQRQPPMYQLSTPVKDEALRSNWQLILEAARADRACYRGVGFELRVGLEELITSTGRQR